MFRLLLPTAAFAALLAGCSQPEEGETGDEFAARVNGNQPQASGPADPAMPRVASNGKQALRKGAAYTQKGLDGQPGSLAINPDGTYALIENGRTQRGNWEWLPDGKRLRLQGVANGPIVLVADGALYRMQNEDVPFDDVTPDRMYSLGREEAR